MTTHSRRNLLGVPQFHSAPPPAAFSLRPSQEERETRKSEGKKGEAKNNEPATEKQKQFMKKLGIEYPADVTKQYASMLIDEKREQNGE